MSGHEALQAAATCCRCLLLVIVVVAAAVCSCPDSNRSQCWPDLWVSFVPVSSVAWLATRLPLRSSSVYVLVGLSGVWGLGSGSAFHLVDCCNYDCAIMIGLVVVGSFLL